MCHMEPLVCHQAHEAVKVLGLLWYWHQWPGREKPAGAAGPGSGSQPWLLQVSQCILFTAASTDHEAELLEV